MAKDSNKSINQRISVIQAFIILCFLLLGAKSFDLQVFKAQVLSQRAENDYSKYITIKGARGQILDRSMNKLATSTDAISISACPSKASVTALFLNTSFFNPAKLFGLNLG